MSNQSSERLRESIYDFILQNASYQIIPHPDSIDVKNWKIECDPHLSGITMIWIDRIYEMTDNEFCYYIKNIISMAYIRHSRFTNALKLILKSNYFNAGSINKIDMKQITKIYS